MKASTAHHRGRVFGTPWPEVHGTQIDSARSFARHSHDSFGIGLIEQGAQRSASGRGEVEAEAGDLICTNPGEVHDGRPLGGPSRRWRMVYLEPELVAAVAARPGEAAAIALARPVIRDSRLRDVLQVLFARLDRWSGARMPTLACEESLTEACTLLLAGHAAAPAVSMFVAVPSRALREARDRLADEVLAPPTLAELAAQAGLSTYQLLRGFEKAYGLPPHAWLLQRRAERARALIRGGASLVQAAAGSGFADQSHMTRVFARRFGFTPGAWARAVVR